jgi:hypothetical protein
MVSRPGSWLQQRTPGQLRVSVVRQNFTSAVSAPNLEATEFRKLPCHGGSFLFFGMKKIRGDDEPQRRQERQGRKTRQELN